MGVGDAPRALQERQEHPGPTIWSCLPGPSGRWTPPRRPSRGGSICPRRHCCRPGAVPSPSCPVLVPRPPRSSQSEENAFPQGKRYPAPGAGCAQGGGSDGGPGQRERPAGPPEGRSRASERRGSRPGWQGWICTERREEERAKVELTYRWLFKSIKGR